MRKKNWKPKWTYERVRFIMGVLTTVLVVGGLYGIYGSFWLGHRFITEMADGGISYGDYFMSFIIVAVLLVLDVGLSILLITIVWDKE